MSHEDHLDRVREISALNINYPVGCKVILKGANDEPYKVGIRVGHELVTKANNVMAVIELENGETVLEGGAIMKKFDERLTYALDKLTPVQQWNVMANNYFLEDPELGDNNGI